MTLPKRATLVSNIDHHKTYYKVRDPKTGLFWNNGYWKKKGRIWSHLAHVRRSMQSIGAASHVWDIIELEVVENRFKNVGQELRDFQQMKEFNANR